MPQKKIQFKEAKEFAEDSGYVFAVYEKQDDGNFHKVEDVLWDCPIVDETEIMVKTTGYATDFKEFETVDGQFCFRLHNNFNVPEIVPVIKRG